MCVMYVRIHKLEKGNLFCPGSQRLGQHGPAEGLCQDESVFKKKRVWALSPETQSVVCSRSQDQTQSLQEEAWAKVDSKRPDGEQAVMSTTCLDYQRVVQAIGFGVWASGLDFG